MKKLDGYNHLSSDTKSILVNLNVADDYFKAKKQADNIEEELAIKEKEMYGMKHELINMQIKLEAAEKSVSTLQMESTEQQKRIVKLETELQDLRKTEKEGAV